MPPDAHSSLPEEVFRSKVDLWLVLLVFGGTLGGLAVAMSSPSSRAGLPRAAGVGIMAVTTALLVLLGVWTYRTTAYVLDDDAMYVRCAGLNWHIAYRDIKSVRATHNPLSAPALSVDRLEIRYGKYAWVLISPKDRAAFIAALKRRAPELEVKA